LFEGFKWFWDLTGDFWAENGERKIMVAVTSIELVAYPSMALLQLNEGWRGRRQSFVIGVVAYILTHRKCVMDWAPGCLGQGENRQRQVQERGVGGVTVVVEKQISPLRRSQRRERLRSK
jgi:hypothetical protein